MWSIQLKEQEQPPGRVEYIVLSPPMGSLRSVLKTERSKKNTENRKRLCEAEVPIYRAQAGFIRRQPQHSPKYTKAAELSKKSIRKGSCDTASYAFDA